MIYYKSKILGSNSVRKSNCLDTAVQKMHNEKKWLASFYTVLIALFFCLLISNTSNPNLYIQFRFGLVVKEQTITEDSITKNPMPTTRRCILEANYKLPRST